MSFIICLKDGTVHNMREVGQRPPFNTVYTTIMVRLRDNWPKCNFGICKYYSLPRHPECSQPSGDAYVPIGPTLRLFCHAAPGWAISDFGRFGPKLRSFTPALAIYAGCKRIQMQGMIRVTAPSHTNEH